MAEWAERNQPIWRDTVLLLSQPGCAGAAAPNEAAIVGLKNAGFTFD